MDAMDMPIEFAGGLRSLSLAPEYRRGHADMVRDFYVPCLRVSCTYLRAAGYFTSQSLALVAAGLPPFIHGGGLMRLIASPYLDSDDIDALARGVRAQSDVVERALLREFSSAQSSEIVRDRLGFLAWLVAAGRLEIRVALPIGGEGLYHEKYGIFIDPTGDAVAFTGSPNETRGGLATNIESIDVFGSWTDEDFRVRLKRAAFEAAWSGEAEGFKTVPLPEAVRNRLLTLRPAHIPAEDPLVSNAPDHETSQTEKVQPPKAREYQLEAAAAWQAAGKRGILEMATGSGKTITALFALDDFVRGGGRPVFAVVAVPYIHLADQWSDEMKPFGLKPTLGYGVSSRWVGELTRAASDLRIGLRQQASCVVTHDALRSPAFRRWFGSIQGRVTTIIIADEVHNLGAPASLRALGELEFNARLGLSATPARWSDEETAALLEYFGPVVYEFPLGKAITEKFLVPYAYYPHFVELTDEEMAAYVEITRRLARTPAAAADEDPGIEAQRGRLLRERAGVLNNAQAKAGSFEAALRADPGSRHTLVYTTPERMNETVRLVADVGRMVHRFTYRESAQERRELLRLFAAGEIDVLVAIRCLDEGVDVPATETAYVLASSSNSREFIQRRGRILRRSNDKTSAVIHDFIALPATEFPDDEAWRYERSIMKRELARFSEFAGLGINRFQAEQALLPLRKRYGLFDL